MMIRIDVLQQYRRSIHRIDHHVNLAVIEEIAKGRAASPREHRETRPLDGRHVIKLAFVGVVEEERALSVCGSPIMVVNLRIDVAVHHHCVLPAVVIVVDKAVSPTYKWDSDLRSEEHTSELQSPM